MTPTPASRLQSAQVAGPTPGGASLILHGGAWDIPDDAISDHLSGLHEAMQLGREALQAEESAAETVVRVIAAMEANGAFDAGKGSVLTSAATVEMDAGLMDGFALEFGAVARVSGVLHPIRIADSLRRGSGEVRLLAGEEAREWAELHGEAVVAPGDQRHPREVARFERIRREREYHSSQSFQEAPKGTVGCVARDRQGRIAAGTSTGGTPFRPPGRIGDSPLPGCGYYADYAGGASATGWGEAIAACGLAGRAVASLERGKGLEEAVRTELKRMSDRIQDPEGRPAAGGLILLAQDGSAAWGYTTPRMARAGWADGVDPWVLL